MHTNNIKVSIIYSWKLVHIGLMKLKINLAYAAFGLLLWVAHDLIIFQFNVQYDVLNYFNFLREGDSYSSTKRCTYCCNQLTSNLYLPQVCINDIMQAVAE